MQELAGKTAIVTGGAAGIGLALARRFAAEGMKLVLADVEAAVLDKAAAELTSEGAEVLAVVCDVSDRAQVEAVAAQALEAFGKIHVVCNNAGVSPFGNLVETSAEDWEWTLGVNLMGVVHGIQVFTPHIRAHGEGGHIVNTASIAGLIALKTLGIYTATKYAVVGISEVLRQELEEDGIGVSVLCPFFVKTGIAESGRNRPSALGGAFDAPADVRQLVSGGSEPAEIAERVLAAIRADELYVLPHDVTRPMVEARFGAVLGAFGKETP